MDLTESDSSPPDAHLLIQRYLDGIANDDEVGYLSQLIESDEDVVSCYVRHAHLHATLAADETLRSDGNALATPVVHSVSVDDIAEGEASFRTVHSGHFGEFPRSVQEVQPQSAGRNLIHAVRWILAAAVCLLLFVGAALLWRVPKQAFATVRSAEGAVGMADVTIIRGEWCRLTEGIVELSTTLNARVVIEAPAKFRFESAQRIRLSYGRLAADVPPSAKGFTVVTRTGDVVDLGTRFGVDVPRHGTAEIHVFQGQVIALPSGGRRQRSLSDGEALLLSSQSGEERKLRSAAFIQPDEVASLHAGLAAGRQDQSGGTLAKLARDPALIALFDFESDALPAGAFRMVQGRWPGSRAPEFVNAADHMKLDVGGDRQWQRLTLAAWVRLDRVGAPFQSLLHTDGWGGDDFGQVHWMLRRNTKMRLAMSGNRFAPNVGDRGQYPDSRSPALSEQHGRWVHLAVVYDSRQRTVRFYLNGRFDTEVQQAVAHPARLGPVQIGNWSGEDRKLSGRIDELLILGRAMTDDEVRSLFEAGNPYHSP